MKKKPYHTPTISEVHLDHTISLIGGCKRNGGESAKTTRRCGAAACKENNATS